MHVLEGLAVIIFLSINSLVTILLPHSDDFFLRNSMNGIYYLDEFVHPEIVSNGCQDPIATDRAILDYNGSPVVVDVYLDPYCAKDFRFIIYNSRVYLAPQGIKRNSSDATIFPNAVVIMDADPHGFEVIAGHYSKDHSHVFFDQFALPDASPSSFTLLDTATAAPTYLSKDYNSVYFYNKTVEGADPHTFEVIGEGIAKDKDNAFAFRTANGVILLLGDASSRSISDPLPVSSGYARIAALPDANLKEITALGYKFTKDEDHVYYDLVELPEADSASFILLSSLYAKDHTNVWYFGRYIDTPIPLEGVDATTFSVINPDVPDDSYASAYGRDKDTVFRREQKIEGSDPNSFEPHIKNDEFYNYWSKDKNHVYFEGGKTDLDPATFRVINDGSQKDCGYGPYVQDKNGIFQLDFSGLRKLEETDPTQFEPQNFKVECDMG